MRFRLISGQTRHVCGWVRDLPDHRDVPFIPAPRQIPRLVDLRNTCLVVENQGSLGSCAASAATSAYEYLYEKMGRPVPQLSRLFCYYASRVWVDHCDPAEDAGSPLRSTMKALATFGCCFETTWPYQTRSLGLLPPQEAIDEAARHQILRYYKLTDLRSIKLCLAEGSPVVGGFSMPASMDGTGTRCTGFVRYPAASENFIGGHAVLFVGYSDAAEHLIFKNSWGPSWGHRGYGYLPYRFILNNLASDFWTIRTAKM